MADVTEYAVMDDTSPNGLAAQVNAKLKEGWSIWGQMQVLPSVDPRGNASLLQTMILRASKAEKAPVGIRDSLAPLFVPPRDPRRFSTVKRGSK